MIYNKTKDNRVILWIQDTRKWFSPGKLSPINGLLRKCFIQMKSLPTLHAVPVLRWFVWLVCLIDTVLVFKKWFHKITLSDKIILFYFATHLCVPVSEKQLISTELNNLTNYHYVKEDNSITICKHVLRHHRPISKKYHRWCVILVPTFSKQQYFNCWKCRLGHQCCANVTKPQWRVDSSSLLINTKIVRLFNHASCLESCYL